MAVELTQRGLLRSGAGAGAAFGVAALGLPGLAKADEEGGDIGDYDLPTRFIASDTFLAGTIRRIDGSWAFQAMTAGKAFPLSFDHYYLP